MAKIFFLPIAMKLASIIENGLLIIYHQGTKIFLTGRSPFSAKRVEKSILLVTGLVTALWWML